jgi:outer membrane protein OmpA-like peptidoglycan-associated protein
MLCLPSDRTYALTIRKKGYLFYSENVQMKQKGSIELRDFELQKLAEGEQVRLDNIFFELDSYELKDESVIELNMIIKFLESNPFLVIEIGGHTDNSGSKDYNLQLSNERAKSLRKALVDRGIKPERVLFNGYGMSKPLNDNSSEEKRAVNRRTELTIISVE